MTTIGTVTDEPTAESIWQAIAGIAIDDHLLEWPADVFALTDTLLERSEAYRFALSPPEGAEWPPPDVPGWSDAVVDAARQWSSWVEDRHGPLPDLLVREWKALRDAAGSPFIHVSQAHDWRLCSALLTVHAIADEACAGLGVALDASEGDGVRYRARGRELLARTGSLTRIPTHRLRVLPKIRTARTGSSVRALSRYASVHSPGVELRWHKVPSRRAGTPLYDKGVNYLLLPWPLRVRESDFRPVPESVQRLATEAFGYFEFVPSEGLDLDLVDRMLVAALDEVPCVSVVVLPESAVDLREVDELEALLGHHGVKGLITGVRERPSQPGQFPGNWVHLGVSTGAQWVHIKQSKHHRWSLDEPQIHQYHLGGALHPHVRWWEATEVPRRSVQLIEVGEGATVVSLVCEDLAQIDHVADLIRSVGPTIVVTPLLDGPQLSSRWSARYASVLADDPGSAVLTLTSYGMVQRSRPPGRNSSAVVALWKNPGQGIREIPLEAGAQGILLSASTDRAMRRSADGRRPIANGSELFEISVYQVRAAKSGSGLPYDRTGSAAPPVLDTGELTILSCWAEAVADALAFAPEQLEAIRGDAHAGAAWRAELHLPEPSAELNQALCRMFRAARTATDVGDDQPLDALILAMRDSQLGNPGLDQLVGRVLRSAIEQRRNRQGTHANFSQSTEERPPIPSAGSQRLSQHAC
jgi:hypothetical protein